MRLHLIRHGQTDYNRLRRVQGQRESRLDDEGREQARALGVEIRDVPFVALHVSAATRTRETASLAFAGRDLPTSFHDDLREMRLGRWEDRMWADIEREEPENARAYFAFDEALDVDGAEGFAELQRRGLDAIAGVLRREREAGRGGAHDDVAVVSHGAIVRAMLAAWLDLALARFEGQPALPNCSRSIVAAGDDGAVEVVTIASHAPLESQWATLLGGRPAPTAAGADGAAPPP